MHIAHPVIATFFVAKRWDRMAKALVFYNAVLIPAIVLLEWHYVVDIIAGILLAAVALVLTSRRSLFERVRISQNVPQPTHTFASRLRDE